VNAVDHGERATEFLRVAAWSVKNGAPNSAASRAYYAAYHGAAAAIERLGGEGGPWKHSAIQELATEFVEAVSAPARGAR
jgi:uncharacterized protein (UPF0332 family)